MIYNGSKRIVQREARMFGVETNIRGIDPDPCAVGVRDLRIRMHLIDRHSQRGLPIDNSVLAKENDLAGGRSFCHER